jgi:hypothetical protein
MPTIVDTVIRDGETINIYESGAEYNATRGHLVKPPPHALITPERSRQLREMRAAKAARLLREKITAATAKVSDLPIKSAPEAVAEVGGILWEEIVLNADAYPRDRMEAFEKLTERAEMSNKVNRENSEKNISDVGVLAASAALTELVGFLRSAIQPRETIDGAVSDVNDTRNENGG